MEKGTVFLIVLICVGTMAGFAVWEVMIPSKQVLTVYHAGSLSIPFEEVRVEFEKQHPTVDIQLFSMGSVKLVRQITDLGKSVDVAAVADYRLIPEMMYPKFADWVVRFARNEMVLVYTNKSKYSKEINPENWYNVLKRKSVTFGFANPNMDPCGYRAVMVVQLAELYYNDPEIFDNLILNNTNIRVSEEGGTYLITVPENLEPVTGKVVIRPKSVELVALIEEGGLDYAFEYRSVAIQHKLMFVDLPDKIDLSQPSYTNFYGKVSLIRADGKKCTGKPVVYGLTVPKNSLRPSLGLKLVKFILSNKGRKILDDCGQPPIVPPVGTGNIPEELKPSLQK